MSEDPQERTWAMPCHLAALAGLVTGLGFILGPLVVWLVKKDQYPLVDDQGKESLNFQISMFIYGLLAGLLVIVLVGFALLALIAVFDLIMVIVAAVAANNGQRYRYPLTLRLIK